MLQVYYYHQLGRRHNGMAVQNELWCTLSLALCAWRLSPQVWYDTIFHHKYGVRDNRSTLNTKTGYDDRSFQGPFYRLDHPIKCYSTKRQQLVNEVTGHSHQSQSNNR